MPKLPYNVDTDMTVFGDLVTTENVRVLGSITLEETDLIFNDSDNNYPTDGSGVVWDLNQKFIKLFARQNVPGGPADVNFDFGTGVFPLTISDTGSVTINEEYSFPISAGDDHQVLSYSSSSGNLTWKNSNTSTISADAPVSPIDGDLWYDASDTYRLYVYSDTAGVWIDASPNDTSGVTFSDNAPSNPLDGDIWYDTGSTYRTYFYSSSAQVWIDSSPTESPNITISDNAPSNPLDGELWYDSGSSYRTFVYSSSAQVWIDASPNDTIDSDLFIEKHASLINNSSISTPSYIFFGESTAFTGVTDQELKTSMGTSSGGIRIPSDGTITSIGIQTKVVSGSAADRTLTVELVKNSVKVGKSITLMCDSDTDLGISTDLENPESFTKEDTISVFITHNNASLQTSDHACTIRILT